MVPLIRVLEAPPPKPKMSASDPDEEDDTGARKVCITCTYYSSVSPFIIFSHYQAFVFFLFLKIEFTSLLSLLTGESNEENIISEASQ